MEDSSAEQSRVDEPELGPRRTLILSDAHGYPSFIEDALEHAEFEPALDRLIFAGDFIDRGPYPQRCLDLVEASADIVLFGNHELELMIDAPMEPDGPGSRLKAPLIERFWQSPERWRFAAAVGDVLVTHAGLSAMYLASLGRDASVGAGDLAEAIERQARFEIGIVLGMGVADYDGVLSANGPLWFRPDGAFLAEIPTGLVQVAGHTPPEVSNGDLREHGMRLVDPFAYSGAPHGGRCRYGVIDGDGVRVISLGGVSIH